MLMTVLTQIFSICIKIWPTENSRSSMALTTQNSNPIRVPCRHKPVGLPRYSITVFDLETGAWDLLDSILNYPDGLPLFCHLASCDGELVALGGAGGVAMPRRASFFIMGVHGRRVYVVEGHNEGKNAQRSVWAYDVGRGEWAELPPMSHDGDKCEGVVAAEGQSFWVVNGGTRRCTNSGPREWRRAERVWPLERCPSLCIGAGRDERLFDWARLDLAIRVETCRVELGGGRTLGFYVAEGQNKKLERINMPDKFSEFARTGCRVEV
ncbi:hypothetical protein ACJRO7_004758 [Eucalyptus globulus]|uniref:F-box/kelch-repeat protein n=1 Tax=Eucalyptus globulus TaxID=34317 RepID=A0ABD3J1T3_EUCGL